MVAAAPLLKAPTPRLVVSCTDTSVHWSTGTLPKPVAQQLGVVSDPVTVAEIPVLTGSSNPHGLV